MEIIDNFAVLEGPDGSGTTTQLNILEAFFHQGRISNPDKLVVAESGPGYLQRDSLPAFYKTFEPTDGIIGRIIRSGLRKEADLKPETIAMLFAADRNEHLFGSGGIIERCKRGELVISDRYVPSSLVYQGITCGDDVPAVLNKSFPGPELLIYLDIDPEIAQKRMTGRDFKEIYEYLDFQVEVRRRYKALLPQLQANSIRVEIIDASPPPEEVAREVWRSISKMPIFNK